MLLSLLTVKDNFSLLPRRYSNATQKGLKLLIIYADYNVRWVIN